MPKAISEKQLELLRKRRTQVVQNVRSLAIEIIDKGLLDERIDVLSTVLAAADDGKCGCRGVCGCYDKCSAPTAAGRPVEGRPAPNARLVEASRKRRR